MNVLTGREMPVWVLRCNILSSFNSTMYNYPFATWDTWYFSIALKVKIDRQMPGVRKHASGVEQLQQLEVAEDHLSIWNCMLFAELK